MTRGSLCYLLQIRELEQLLTHPLRGAIFENWVLVEKMKNYFNRGEEPPFYFWRDIKGNEVDLLIDEGDSLYPIEIKSAQTFHPSLLRNIEFFSKLQLSKNPQDKGMCIYAGEQSLSYKEFRIQSWKEA